MRFFFVLLAAFAGFSAYLLFFQHRLIYFPRHYDASALPPDVKPVTYHTGAGQQTSLYLPPAGDNLRTPDRIWLILGGNASLSLDWLSFARRFPDRKTAFLLFDYPGYGQCDGKASPRAIMDSLDQCLVALSSKLHLVLPDLVGRMAVIGHSLGSGAALRLALHYPIKNIILVSPFTSMLEMAKRAVPFPFYHLLLHRFDNSKALDILLAAADKPAIVILHGERDEIVPVEMARTLARRHQTDLLYVEVKGVNHNDIIDVAESDIHRLMDRAR